jgi:hypothetical protein
MKKIAVALPMKTRIRLRDSIEWACIIAHKEDTSPLEKALGPRGSGPRRSAFRCHRKKCNTAQASVVSSITGGRGSKPHKLGGLSLIVEADFVPCRGFGSFSLPIPASDLDSAVAWLYL